MGKFIDITGQKFSRLTVVDFSHLNKHKSAVWNCICDCGTKKQINGTSLRKGYIKSCGCLRDEVAKVFHKTHGMVKTNPYYTWAGMKHRCNKETSNKWKSYGGRGITYDPKWETFEGFLEDMGESWQEGLSIDRIDVNGNYCKENCKWSTRKEQMNNKTDNHYITYDGRIQTMTQWARELGMKDHTLSNRLCKGWSIERAFTQPIKTTKK